MTYKIVKIAGFYKAFLTDYYAKNEEIRQKSYNEQYQHLMAQGHAWSDYFQRHFFKLGIEAHEIIANAEPLQSAWARENGISTKDDIVLAQLKKIKPDIIFFQDAIRFDAMYYKMLKKELPYVKFIFGHCCTAFTKENLQGFREMKFMLSCSPGFTQIFSKNDIPSYEFLHAFETEIINKLNENPYPESDILFSGSFVRTSNTLFHDMRLKYIEQIIENKLPLTIYGNVDFETKGITFTKQMAYISSHLFKTSGLGFLNRKIPFLGKTALLTEFPRYTKFRKDFIQLLKTPVYGLEMLKATAKAKISFNIHAGIAGDYAANMRMFEVTGTGSLLCTDYKKNLNTIFEPDSEIITYHSIDECISKLKWALENPEAAQKIAAAGQARTLKDHTIEKRVNQLHEIICNELL